MKRFFLALSALLCLFGGLLIYAGLIYIWVEILSATMEQFGSLVGWLALIGSLLGFYYWPDILAAPWRFWGGFWHYLDDELDKRLSN